MHPNIPIALVDDHTLFRKGLAELINSLPGYQVILECGNGLELEAALVNGEKPQIVLLDIMMPQRNGYDTAAWLRSNHPDIYILALSTMDNETSIIRMIKNGAHGYILKDTDVPELEKAFDDILKDGFYYNKQVSHKIIRSLNSLVDDQSKLRQFLQLNETEMRFLELACSEKSYQQIAAEMNKSEKTIDGYRAELFRKLQVSSRVGLVLYAVRAGLITL